MRRRVEKLLYVLKIFLINFFEKMKRFIDPLGSSSHLLTPP
jgi:hypothetical protein